MRNTSSLRPEWPSLQRTRACDVTCITSIHSVCSTNESVVRMLLAIIKAALRAYWRHRIVTYFSTFFDGQLYFEHPCCFFFVCNDNLNSKTRVYGTVDEANLLLPPFSCRENTKRNIPNMAQLTSIDIFIMGGESRFELSHFRLLTSKTPTV